MDGDHNMEIDQEWVARFVVVVSATAAAMHYYNQRGAYIDRVPCRTSALQGSAWVTEILHGHPARCTQLFRMKKEIFRQLCIDLRDKYMLPTTNTVQIPEMVGIFLFTLGQGASNRLLQECFQHSGETISRIFRQVLHSVYIMSIDIIKPRDNQFNTVPARIRNDPKYSPFKDCIGAIDGTHIPAIMPKDDRGRFIGRKGFTTQNVMAACDFDMLYIFVSAGWEGSAHDARVFQDAITTESLNFPHPPPGKYYLVDAGYPNRIGYLAPYRGERYHSSQFGTGRNASGPHEVFNHVHSSLRNVIERTFGVTKNRWPILRNMRSFPFEIQVQIVVACMALHNFIRLRVADDDEFDEEPSCSYEESPIESDVAGDSDLRDDNTMTRVRDVIANKLVRRRDRN